MYYDLFFDGLDYSGPYKGNWNIIDQISADFIPSVIGIYLLNLILYGGVLASDNAGYVTDSSWKCTKYAHADWMLPDYDDSAWPQGLMLHNNGNRTSAINGYWNWGFDSVTHRAWWTYAVDSSQIDYAYCRVRLNYTGKLQPTN